MAARAVKLSADPSGALSFDTSSLSAKAGNVTIDFDNPAASGRSRPCARCARRERRCPLRHQPRRRRGSRRGDSPASARFSSRLTCDRARRRALFAEAVAWRGRSTSSSSTRRRCSKRRSRAATRCGTRTGGGRAGQPSRAGEPHARGGTPLPRPGRRHDRRALELGGGTGLGDRAALRLRRVEGRAARTSRRRSPATTPRTGSSPTSSRRASSGRRCPRSRPSRAGGVDAVNAALAMGEMVPPEEVAELIAFLSTGRSRHLSGATIDVNGATYIR